MRHRPLQFRRWRRFGLAIGLVALPLPLAFVGWTRVARYPAHPAGVAAAARAERSAGGLLFAPHETPRAGVIIYPGGLVDAAAYAPWAESLATHGLLSVVVPMPLELAVFGIDRARRVIAANPEVDRWWLVGHSLGGAMASELIVRHPDLFEGLLLLASFPAATTDLSGLPLAAVSVYGSENGLTPPQGFIDSQARLPSGAKLMEIAGGNHAQFGDYGPQRGDGEPRISREAQQRYATEALLAALEAER